MADWRKRFTFEIEGERIEFELRDRGVKGFEDNFHRFKLVAKSALPNTKKLNWTMTWIVRKRRWVNHGDVSLLRERYPTLSHVVIPMMMKRIRGE